MKLSDLSCFDEISDTDQFKGYFYLLLNQEQYWQFVPPVHSLNVTALSPLWAWALWSDLFLTLECQQLK